MQKGPATPPSSRLTSAGSSSAAAAHPSDGRHEELPPVPVGLEHLLALGSTSEPFAAALRKDPQRAADAAGIELFPSERAILGAVDGPTLDTMIARVKPALVEPDRRIFLERAAAAVAILVGGAALPGCETTSGKGKPLPKRRPERPPATAGGARVDRPHEPPPPTGIQPDRPPRRPDPQPRPDAGAPRDTSGASDPLPQGGGGSYPSGVAIHEKRVGQGPTADQPCQDPPRDRPSYVNAKGGVRPR
ncbi:MAG: hypothetical protein RBU30_00070 [Polyangia bacterium]|jgi:hypothetical protein|nr:hypothetical protein [Polyangia bacterium]